MHEQTTASQLRDQILNHPVARNMDAHNRHALATNVNGKSPTELSKVLRDLSE